MKKSSIEYPIGWVDVPLSELVKAPWNYKGEDEQTSTQLHNSLKKYGLIQNLIIRWLPSGKYEVCNGNHRLDELALLKHKTAHCYNLGDVSLQVAQRISIETNELHFEAVPEKLEAIIESLAQNFDDLIDTLPKQILDDYEHLLNNSLLHKDKEPEEETQHQEQGRDGSLFEQFIIPPFSFLDSTQGNWINRKNQWLELGIKSEIGRKEDLLFGTSAQPKRVYTMKNKVETEVGRELTWEEFYQIAEEKGLELPKLELTSIFDPVLCELVYTWFKPLEGNKILDPLAGGSVRGVVAAVLGFDYTGI